MSGPIVPPVVFGPLVSPASTALLDECFNYQAGTILDTVAQLRLTTPKSPTLTPPRLFVTGVGGTTGAGAWYYFNASDTTSADNGFSIIVAADGGRWYLTGINGYVATPAELAAAVPIVNHNLRPGYVQRYGTNTVPGTTDMTAAIRAAIAQAIQPGGDEVFFQCCSGGSGVTANDYRITAEIDIAGSVRLRGETDRLSFQGPRVVQSTNNLSCFTVTQGVPAAVTVQDLELNYGGNTALAGSALFYVNPAAPGPNSFYFKGCWFSTPCYYAINVNACDDVRIEACTFDVTAQRWIGVGGTGVVTNMSIIGCTFYNQVPLGFIDIQQVKNFIFQGNRVYGDGVHQIPYVLDFQTNSIANIGAAVIGNTFDGANQLVKVNSNTSNLIVSGNVAKGVSNSMAIGIGGGVAVNKLSITNNLFSGYAGGAFGMIDATGTPVTNSVISDNTLECNVGGTSGYGVYLPSGSNNNSRIMNNVVVGSTTADVSIGNPAANWLTLDGVFTPTIAGSVTPGTLTYSTQAGRYKIIGRVVFFDLMIVVTGISVAPTGNLTIAGLPLAIGAVPMAASLGEKTALTATYAQVQVLGNAGATTLRLGSSDATHDFTDIPVAGLATNTTITVSGSYFID